LLLWATFPNLRHFTLMIIRDKIMVDPVDKMLIFLNLVYQTLSVSDLFTGVLAMLPIYLHLQLAN